MSDIKDQPPPVATAGASMWDLVILDIEAKTDGLLNGQMGRQLKKIVIDDMRERDHVGRERYGTPLQAHNDRDALVDAYQEALDAVVYLRQAHEEMGPQHKHGEPICVAYTLAIKTMLQVRVAILCREEVGS